MNDDTTDEYGDPYYGVRLNYATAQVNKMLAQDAVDRRERATATQRLSIADKIEDMYRKWKEDWAQGVSAPEQGNPYNPNDLMTRVLDTVIKGNDVTR